MCAPTGTTQLFDLATYGFEHGTEDERKNLWDWQMSSVFLNRSVR